MALIPTQLSTLSIVRGHPVYIRLLLLQGALVFLAAAVLTWLNQPLLALLFALAAVVGGIADGLMLLGLRLNGARGLALGLFLRWGLLAVALSIAAMRLPQWPEMVLFTVCLVGLRPLVSLFLGGVGEPKIPMQPKA